MMQMKITDIFRDTPMPFSTQEYWLTFEKTKIPAENLGCTSSDEHLISSYNSTSNSNIRVMKIREMITN